MSNIIARQKLYYKYNVPDDGIILFLLAVVHAKLDKYVIVVIYRKTSQLFNMRYHAQQDCVLAENSFSSIYSNSLFLRISWEYLDFWLIINRSHGNLYYFFSFYYYYFFINITYTMPANRYTICSRIYDCLGKWT